MRFSILLPVVAYLLWFQTAADGLMDKATIVTTESQHVFTVELAATSKARQQGLMYRRELARIVGLLVIFPSLVVAPTSVNGSKSILTVLAFGPESIKISIR